MLFILGEKSCGYGTFNVTMQPFLLTSHNYKRKERECGQNSPS